MQIDIKTLFDSIERQPVDSLTAYRDCLFVMANCAPLRLNELLSINPDTAEVWHTTPGGTKEYAWRYKSAKTKIKSDEATILIPDSIANLAQKAIQRLRELQPQMTPISLEALAKNRKLRSNCFQIRRLYAEAVYRSSSIGFDKYK
jgi:hypothetical protein